jgi:hypothetical protein
MAGGLNKQPIFTATPLTVCIGTDIEKNTGDTYYTDVVTTIYSDASTYGTMISKVTVKANATLAAGENTVSSKRIDFYISNDGDSSKFDLYATQYMTGLATITAASTVPSVVFEFPTGLVLSPGKKLALSATENNANSSYDGDFVSIIIEGGTYDQPA